MSRKWAFTFGAIVASLAPFAGVAQPSPAIARYEALTSVVVNNCRTPRNDREIVVCGRRQGDRYRVPFVGYEPGDPRGESVTGERNRLASAPAPKCGLGAVLANCGSVGVNVGTRVGVSGGGLKLRPLGE